MSIPDRPIPSLSGIRIPRYLYFPADQNQCGPQQWERLRILQACERLRIPRERWPHCAFPQAPRYSINTWIPNRPEKFNLPPFQPLIETIPEWRKKCHAAFGKTLDEYAEKFLATFRRELAEGKYQKVPLTRNTTASDLRYEWAAQRYCYNTPYKELADLEKGLSEDRVKRSVHRILKKAGLNEGT